MRLLIIAPALLALARRFPALTRRRDARPRFAAVLGLAAILLAACAPSASQPATGGEPSTIQIELKDFAFKPSRITLKAGQSVTLKLVNTDVVEHEFMAGRQANATEGGFAEDLFKDVQLDIKGGKASAHGHSGSGVLVDVGKTAEISFTVPSKKGTYEIGCFVPGHYVAGMKGTLVVQ